jgi:hypothetical protein
MGVMPENRSRRWSSLFRRYGIGADAEAEARQEPDAERLDPLKEKAQEALLPDGILDKKSRPTRRPRRAR